LQAGRATVSASSAAPGGRSDVAHNSGYRTLASNLQLQSVTKLAVLPMPGPLKLLQQLLA
jgi:hypothetical protein